MVVNISFEMYPYFVQAPVLPFKMVRNIFCLLYSDVHGHKAVPRYTVFDASAFAYMTCNEMNSILSKSASILVCSRMSIICVDVVALSLPDLYNVIYCLGLGCFLLNAQVLPIRPTWYLFFCSLQCLHSLVIPRYFGCKRATFIF